MTINFRSILFLVTILALSFSFAKSCEAVSLRSATDVNRPTVKLSDVFEGLPAGIDCDIARAPTPGRSITYDVNVLTRLAQQYKLDWQPQGIADHTTITTVGTKITSDDMRATIIDRMKDYNIQGDIDVQFDNHALEITVPSDRPSNMALNNFSYDTINKRFHGELLADGFAGPIDLTLSGRIIVRHSVPVLVHRLEAGTIIGATDIDWLSVPEDRMNGVAIDTNQLIGRELQHTTEAGIPIREHDAIAPRLVVRGSIVTMKIETSNMIVTAQGRALQDGKLGDTVRITNIQSNRTIEGVVEGDGVVRIAAVQKIAAAIPPTTQE